jgi:hypothetical protein
VLAAAHHYHQQVYSQTIPSWLHTATINHTKHYQVNTQHINRVLALIALTIHRLR